MLDISGLTATYGRRAALQEISLHVRKGEIVALVGANGAGKTTLLNAISGVLRPTRGAVTYRDKAIHRTSPERIVRLGLCHVPEGRQLFGAMTVRDNLLLGAYTRGRAEKRTQLATDLERVYSIFPILHERAAQRSDTLSGGEQQMLAIGRGLMAQPSMLLFDEPSMGLAPKVMEEIFLSIARFRDHGLTVLLVEQNARWALRIADRGYVLETGRIVMEGSAAELRDHPDIQRAYLGKGRLGCRETPVTGCGV